MIDHLRLWLDSKARSGPENMAIDEWLLKTKTLPVLRVYAWEPGWGSHGYFIPRSEAEAAVAELKWIRRWTGGGIVDHRNDWTYTLVIPKGSDELAELKGAESYRRIHQSLARALKQAGVATEISGETPISKGGECFLKAVEFDLLDEIGKKLAGAGQRRTRHGLLHQGSVATLVEEDLAEVFATELADEVQREEIEIDEPAIAEILTRRYASETWAFKR